MTKRLSLPLRWLLCLMLGSAAMARAQDIPPHLALARSLLAEVQPENNDYRHRGWIRVKGETGTFGTFGRVDTSEVHTDCSGLVDALFERTAPRQLEVFRDKRWKSYPKAENYYEVIAAGEGFLTRPTLHAVEVGDIFAVKFDASADTGHVMIVDRAPALLATPLKPIVPGTLQWKVTVIDASSAHGKSDTRHRDDGTRQTGIGRGSVRVYTDENGVPQAWVMSDEARSKLRSSGTLAFGKPAR